MIFDVKADGTYQKKTVYVIIGIKLDGRKELSGLWIGENETSKYWLSVINDLKSRGVEDILIACVDGLNGFEQAIYSVPSDEALFKLLYLVSQDITKKWTMPIPNWSLIFNQFLISLEKRLERFI